MDEEVVSSFPASLEPGGNRGLELAPIVPPDQDPCGIHGFYLQNQDRIIGGRGRLGAWTLQRYLGHRITPGKLS
jgi:hypothetical protein